MKMTKKTAREIIRLEMIGGAFTIGADVSDYDSFFKSRPDAKKFRKEFLKYRKAVLRFRKELDNLKDFIKE